jgi:hypothetical protein
MKEIRLLKVALPAVILVFALSCQKEDGIVLQNQNGINSASVMAETPPFNLEVILRGEGNQFGHVKFRQDVDPAKIIILDTWIRDLEPNHEYLLQRAADSYDGNCTSISWLTLGKGLTPQSILTDDKGKGSESLWRDVSGIPTGTHFDIHFRVIDKATNVIVLNSDCYDYVVR